MLERLARGELTTAQAQRLLGAHGEAELGRRVREEPPREEWVVFAAILGLLLLELMFDALFITGLLGGWEQPFLAFLLGMAVLVLGLMLDLYRRSFVPQVLELKRRRPKVVPRLER